jgi:hypothetical protein
MASAASTLTPAQHAQWANDGYIIVSIFTRRVAAQLKAEMLSRLALVGDKVDAVASGDTPNTTGVSVWFPADVPPFFAKHLLEGELPKTISELLGGAPLEFLSTKPVYKSGEVLYPSPWHQDWEYWNGAEKISAWIAVDDAEVANGCLKVVPGTQKMGRLAHDGDTEETFGFVNVIDAGSMERTMSERSAELGGETTLAAATVDCVISAGHAIIFSDRLVHASNANVNGADRYSMIPTYRRADVPDSSVVWDTALPVSL